MIYLDSSVALAAIFAEANQPADAFWRQELISSRLLEYEVMTRLNARALGLAAVDAARDLIEEVELLDLTPDVLARALQPFPVQVRTLDGLHLATMVYARGHGQTIEVATYDLRLAQVATALGCPIAVM